MRAREIATAEKFHILDRIKKFESELLEIPGVVNEECSDGICFDLDGFYDNINYVIIVPKYNIDVRRADYYAARHAMILRIIETAGKYGLTRTEDTMEDYGEHFYIVFKCDTTWKPAMDL